MYSPQPRLTGMQRIWRQLSEPLNTQKAQRAQKGYVPLMKTKYVSVGGSEYAVLRSWVLFYCRVFDTTC
ncbi:MAG: hypothetical protein HWD58_13915 [Bacteroidota bacterium]|nr:MAG: hypothetical protein HWD58_13915 [Bacteroidota bacterium]